MRRALHGSQQSVDLFPVIFLSSVAACLILLLTFVFSIQKRQCESSPEPVVMFEVVYEDVQSCPDSPVSIPEVLEPPPRPRALMRAHVRSERTHQRYIRI